MHEEEVSKETVNNEKKRRVQGGVSTSDLVLSAIVHHDAFPIIL
jgi:hypothetical protein